VTDPFPVPLAPAPIVIHESLLAAVQLQPAPAVTVIEPLAAIADGSADEVGEMVKVQGAPGCVTLNVWPATVSVPVRDVVPVFAATL
jgi:hypothetical protein